MTLTSTPQEPWLGTPSRSGYRSTSLVQTWLWASTHLRWGDGPLSSCIGPTDEPEVLLALVRSRFLVGHLS